MERADVIYTHLFTLDKQASAMLNGRKTMSVSHRLEPEICSSASLFASNRSTCFTHVSGVLHKMHLEKHISAKKKKKKG